MSPAFFLSTDSGLTGSFSVDASDPALQFTLTVGESVAVRNDFDSAAPCLRGDAVDLLEAVSLRCPLPADTPAEWCDLQQGLTAAFS